MLNRSSGWLALVLIICILLSSSVGLYHELSMETFSVQNLKEDSYFGYSITYQANQRILVISAPKENRIGAVYKFNIDSKIANPVETPSVLLDGAKALQNANGTDFLLGATVKAGPSFFVMCAPRYHKVQNDNLKRMMTFGLCFVTPTDRPALTLLENTKLTNYNLENKMTSNGWSLDVTPTNSVLVGGPFMTQGRFKVYRKGLKTKSEPNLLLPPLKTYKVKTILDEDMSLFNFGYATTYGNYFNGNSITGMYYAVSSTFWYNGEAMVFFFDASTLKLFRYYIQNKKIGSLFGASLCTLNLKDRRDSLIVGAPTYVQGSTGFDRGAVFLYVPNRQYDVLTPAKIIIGKYNGAYFGNAVANLGDLDGDMKDEVAVGAPYENDGRGAVYIYSGAGLLDPSRTDDRMLLQKIQPEDSTGLRSFGFSLTSILDFDDNGCNELGVGAPGSNKAVVFKCFAYVTINLFVKFPEAKQVKGKDKRFKFQSCVNVTFAEKPTKVEADLVIKVEIMHPDVKLINHTGHTVRSLTYDQLLTKDQDLYCKDIEILAPKKGNYDQPLTYTISASQRGDPQSITDFKPTRVLLSKQSILSVTGQQSLADCKGESGKCEPDLKIKYNPDIPNFYTVGSTTNGSFSFLIRNEGDTAYTACLLVQVKGAMILLKPPGCTYENGNGVLCTTNVGLGTDDVWNTENIVIDTSTLTGRDELITIYYTLYDHCNDRTDKKYPTHEEKIILESDSQGITIQTTSDPNDIVNIYSESSQVRHLYTVTNNGPTNWVDINIDFVLMKKKNVEYYERIVEVDADMQVTCQITNTTEEEVLVGCSPVDLKSDHELKIFIPIQVSPFEDSRTDNVQNITTVLNIQLKEDKTLTSSVSTTLQCKILTVPLWIIVTSCLIGLLVVILITYAVSELGFLRRKKRAQLKNLRKSVYRQSVRRMSMRQSHRSSEQEGEVLIYPLQHGEQEI